MKIPFYNTLEVSAFLLSYQEYQSRKRLVTTALVWSYKECVCKCDAVIQFIRQALSFDWTSARASCTIIICPITWSSRWSGSMPWLCVCVMWSIPAKLVAEFANCFKNFNGPIQSKLLSSLENISWISCCEKVCRIWLVKSYQNFLVISERSCYPNK